MSRSKKETVVLQGEQMKEIKIKVWTVSGKPNAAANAFPADVVEKKVAEYLEDGWSLLPNFPVYVGREDVMTEKGAGLGLLFVFGK